MNHRRIRAVSAPMVLRATAEVFGIPASDIANDKRYQDAVLARWAYCVAGRRLTQNSFAGLARYIKRHHTTVIYGHAHGLEREATNPEYAALVDAVVGLSKHIAATGTVETANA